MVQFLGVARERPSRKRSISQMMESHRSFQSLFDQEERLLNQLERRMQGLEPVSHDKDQLRRMTKTVTVGELSLEFHFSAPSLSGSFQWSPCSRSTYRTYERCRGEINRRNEGNHHFPPFRQDLTGARKKQPRLFHSSYLRTKNVDGCMPCMSR